MKVVQKIDENGLNMIYVAEESISKDAYFEIGNDLYVALSAITAGDAITPGTNCEIQTVAEALNTVA